MQDPYHISTETIQNPPLSLIAKLKFLGPGLIISASIVGSGELIATTILGAKAGFTALWIILLSCLIKVAVQLEFGKHTILSGETAMEAFSKLPGPKIRKVNWSLWMVFLVIFSKIIQVGGILGGTAVVLNMLFGGISIQFWAIIAAIITILLIYKGNYQRIEFISLCMIGLFTMLTLTSLFSIRYTPFQFSWREIASGFNFHISGDLILFAIGAFGITGVASDEIIAYNYWCIEKGYAAFTGPFQDTDEWKKRAIGWIKVMYLDALVAMLIYTTVTVAFFLLGAAILHKRQHIPMGNEVIETLALIYTQTLGISIKNVYLVGAFFVLFSSLYATLAAWTRMIPDIAGHFAWIDFWNIEQRKKTANFLAILIPSCWTIAYLFFNTPVLMVLSGGVAGSILLFLVVFATCYFKYGRTQIIKANMLYDLFFWLSILSILSVGVYGVYKLFVP